MMCVKFVEQAIWRLQNELRKFFFKLNKRNFVPQWDAMNFWMNMENENVVDEKDVKDTLILLILLHWLNSMDFLNI